MKLLLIAILGFFAPFIFASIAEEEGVLVLTDSNFSDAIEEHKQILIEFYAPWCGHCKSLAPEYAKAAKALADAPVKLAKVDATANNQLAKSFEIKGFPTLKYFKNGKPSDYNGGRTESEIVAWLSKKIGPAVTVIKDEEALLKFQEAHEAFALGIFDAADSESAKKFASVASADDSHAFAVTTDAGVREKLGTSGDAVVVLKSFDDLRSDLALTDATTEDEIVEFVSANTVPLIQIFTPESSKKIFGSKIQKHLLFFTKHGSSHHEPILSTYRAAAAQFKGKVLFVNVPTSEKKILEFFDLTEDNVPATILADLGAESGIKKYIFSGEHNTDAVVEYLTSFFAGKLLPTLKSEDAEPEDTTGDVVVLRGKTFADLVLNNDKDVFVEFYAPWCGHCKKLAPTWEELGETMKGKVVIAKMDTTANEIDIPGVSVKGFPTLYFFKGTDKSNPVRYEGQRELDEFVSFLNENAGSSISDEL